MGPELNYKLRMDGVLRCNVVRKKKKVINKKVGLALSNKRQGERDVYSTLGFTAQGLYPGFAYPPALRGTFLEKGGNSITLYCIWYATCSRQSETHCIVMCILYIYVYFIPCGVYIHIHIHVLIYTYVYIYIHTYDT